MSVEDKAKLVELEQENARLKAEGATRLAAERNATHASFAETLVQAGKLLPAHKGVTVATLDFMAGQDATVEFGEGDAKKPLVEAFKEFLTALPKQVEFSEVGGGDTAVGDNSDAEDISKRALEFKEAESKAGRDISIVEAVNHVTASK